MAPERRCFQISTRDDAPSHRPRLAMNSPQAKLKRARAAEVQEATDLKKFKSDLLAKSIIKSITKEQTTDRSVSALQFNHVPGSNCGNLFATCAADFATVYDDEHFGDHIALVVQFKNEKTAHVAGGDLTALAWLDARGFSNHEFGDALLAVGGGDDNVVQVISIAEGRVIKLLKGHGGRILALAAGYAVAPSGDAPSRPETVVVLSSDGVATAWNWREETKVAALACPDAISLALTPDGTRAFIGHKDGSVREWNVPAAKNAKNAKIATPAPVNSATLVHLEGAHSGVPIDCARIVPGGPAGSTRLVTKSVDGAIRVSDVDANGKATSAASWRVPGCARPKAGALLDSLCAFGTDPAGEFLAVGNTEGEVFVYDVATGETVKTVEQDRDFKSLNLVRSAAVSADCRHAHAVFGPGTIWRSEVVPELEGLEEDGPSTPPEGGA